MCAAPTQSTSAGATTRKAAFLTQSELAQRWRLSGRTLEKWRWIEEGPRYLKLGGRVLYRLDDVEAFEAANLHGAVQ